MQSCPQRNEPGAPVVVNDVNKLVLFGVVILGSLALAKMLRKFCISQFAHATPPPWANPRALAFF